MCHQIIQEIGEHTHTINDPMNNLPLDMIELDETNNESITDSTTVQLVNDDVHR